MNVDHLKSLFSPRYRVERELGRGGMAVVYLAHDGEFDRDVALKVLLPGLASSIGGQRFLREIEIAAKLSHPNILSLHDSGQTDGQADGRSDELLYYTMPYVEGESLRDRLDRERQLPIDEALTIAAEVAGALAHAHEQGVVHRDIKPENILLRDGHPLVSDFGIARAVTEAGGEKLTQTGITVGTVSYMSPEQGAGEREIDGRSDLYSLGCVLYEMIGGEPPFTGPSDQAVLARHQVEAPPALSTIRASTPPGVEALIGKSLAKNAVDRHESAEHMRVALSDPKVAATGAGARLQRRLKTRVARVGTGVAVAAAVAFGLWRLVPTGGGLNAGVVAVLPFEVAGELQRPLDVESITNLLSNYFGYIERYSPIRPQVVRQAVEDRCPDPPIERACGSLVAAALRSQYHVTGTVTPLPGDSVQIVAYLTDEMERHNIPPVSVRGGHESQENAFGLLNELYQELAVASAREGEMVVANAALSTDNLVAFSAFLDGELYLANFDLQKAGRAFRRATNNDSTFALAWYRLAVIQDWFMIAAGSATSVGQAEVNADQLSTHDQRLLQAHAAHIRGDPFTAEAIYLELLEKDPDDFEVLLQLGYLYFHNGWRMGVSMAKGVDPLRRAVRLEPHPLAKVYLVWELVAGSAEDASMLAEADSLDQREDFDFSAEIAAIRATRARDSVGLAAALDSIPRDGWLLEPMVISPQFIRLGTFVDAVPDLTSYVQLLESLSDSAYLDQRFEGDAQSIFTWRELGLSEIAAYQAGRGRWRAARVAMQAMDRLGGAPAAGRMAMLATLPSPGSFPADADSLRRELQAWHIERLPQMSGQRVGRVMWRFGRQIRWYLLGLLSAQLGDHEAAGAYSDSLEALEPMRDFPTIHLDFALAVRADVLLRQGQPEEALAALESAPRKVHYSVEYVIPGEREVFLRAQALHALGRYDEALQWYTPRGARKLAPVLLAPSHYHRGEIYEDIGDTEKALWHYGAFVELWKDADPEYQPVVRDVRDRMARLAGEG